ncbi:MAG: transposase [Rhizobiales bacterium]|nr:transposase [Hyphomicrobiales bacterium]
MFDRLKETTVVIEQWRKCFNTIRRHSSLSDQPPAPQTSLPKLRHRNRRLQ